MTLVTTDSYVVGALVLGLSIRKECPSVDSGERLLVCLCPKGDWLAPDSIASLRLVYDQIRLVEILDSHDKDRLNLLGRSELGCTLTKIHVWGLTDLRKVIFMDSDMLVLRSMDSLFSAVQVCSGNCSCGSECLCPCDSVKIKSKDEEKIKLRESNARCCCGPLFAASPDSGWPDCFNSGLFVCVPSLKVFNALSHCIEEGECSFDGADQGLLNNFFSEWSHAPALSVENLNFTTNPLDDTTNTNLCRRLPFIFNMTINGEYGYLPALVHNLDGIHAVHFIGRRKPWMISGTSTRTGHPAIDSFYDKWWQIHQKMLESLNNSQERAYFQTLYFSQRRYDVDSEVQTGAQLGEETKGITTFPHDFDPAASAIEKEYFGSYRINWAEDVDSFFASVHLISPNHDLNEKVPPKRLSHVYDQADSDVDNVSICEREFLEDTKINNVWEPNYKEKVVGKALHHVGSVAQKWTLTVGRSASRAETSLSASEQVSAIKIKPSEEVIDIFKALTEEPTAGT